MGGFGNECIINGMHMTYDSGNFYSSYRTTGNLDERNGCDLKKFGKDISSEE